MIAKRDDAAVTVRFPKKVLDRVTRSAKSSGRSRNTEIVVRLADSLGLKSIDSATSGKSSSR